MRIIGGAMTPPTWSVDVAYWPILLKNPIARLGKR
jgi:hypothetical protein